MDDNLLNTIFLGEVASVHNYGAFIKVPGNKNQGLVHRSQVSKAVVDDVTEVLHRGESVWCKVIKLTDDGKVALSMKVVDQGNGQDLDPNGVLIHQDEIKRKNQIGQGGRKVIELGAVLNTTCSKCGTKGHLAKDCFQSRDGKTYELITEEDIADLINAPVLIGTSNSQERSKRLKKLKKSKKGKKEKKCKKKSKKKKNYSSSSSSLSSEDSSDSDSSLQRKHRKRKRHNSLKSTLDHKKLKK